MFSPLSKVSQLKSRGSRILTRSLAPMPVRFGGSVHWFPHNLIVQLQGESFESRSRLCLITMPSVLGRSSDLLAQAPGERIFMWRKQKGGEADGGSTVLGRLRFPQMASPQLESTSLLVFQDVAGPRRPDIMS